MRVIKRYSNRRLYDTSESRTLTQMDLANLVRSGIDLKVVDTSSGRDITMAVLGRIIISEAPRWSDKQQTKELFSKIIMIGGEKSMSILKNTILASIGAIHVTRAKAEKIIDDLIKKGELDKSSRKQAVMELLEKAESSTSKLKDRVAKEAGRAQHEVTSLVKRLNLAKQSDMKKVEAKVDKLAKQMRLLQKKLDSLG
ncbi:MAG: phasin family protein [candidate division Zixibacteria bacterium]|nr:phasin family protein [candidate division Zixibacteria bacterium]MDH3939159.1 phasin family protein [candidate division Zixibacteria bacterium]MDH4033577.1 phasin family protein [candidate division Zixibacteria bacterium]